MQRNPDKFTRMFLALIIAILVVGLAASAVSSPGALTVLDKMMPALMAVIGFFFGQASQRHR